MQIFLEICHIQILMNVSKILENYDIFVDGGIITSETESTIIEIENGQDQNYPRRFFDQRGNFTIMNLIITCARHLEPETEEELIDILEEFGDSDVKVSITKMSGILTAETKLDPIEVVRKIKEMLLDEPWSVRYCLKESFQYRKLLNQKLKKLKKVFQNYLIKF